MASTLPLRPCLMVSDVPHDAHDWTYLVDAYGYHCPGWSEPNDGPGPEPSPPQTDAERVRDLEYVIQRAREALGTDEPVDRCPSCDHKREFHDADGRCWFTVEQGVPERDSVCACRVRRGEA